MPDNNEASSQTWRPPGRPWAGWGSWFGAAAVSSFCSVLSASHARSWAACPSAIAWPTRRGSAAEPGRDITTVLSPLCSNRSMIRISDQWDTGHYYPEVGGVHQGSSCGFSSRSKLTIEMSRALKKLPKPTVMLCQCHWKLGNFVSSKGLPFRASLYFESRNLHLNVMRAKSLLVLVKYHLALL